MSTFSSMASRQARCATSGLCKATQVCGSASNGGINRANTTALSKARPTSGVRRRRARSFGPRGSRAATRSPRPSADNTSSRSTSNTCGQTSTIRCSVRVHRRRAAPLAHVPVLGKQYADYGIELSSLLRVDLSSQWVRRFDDDDAAGTIYGELRQIRELNIRQNLLTCWSQLWPMLDRHCPRLDTIDVSTSRMRVDADADAESRCYPQVKRLVLIDTHGECETSTRLLAAFPRLEQVHLDKNLFTHLSDEFASRLPFITSLSLSDNVHLRRWHPSVNRLAALPSLEELLLNNCGIERVELDQLGASTGGRVRCLVDGRCSFQRRRARRSLA
jgi:hypothetical protein